VAGQLGAMLTPWGPLLPFLTGSTLGFGVGVWGNWRRVVDRARQYARCYPQILAHALWTEHRVVVPAHMIVVAAPQQQSKEDSQHSPGAQPQDNYHPMEEWVTSQGIRHLSWCVLAAQSCQGDVEEVDRQERQRIVDGFHRANKEDDDD